MKQNGAWRWATVDGAQPAVQKDAQAARLRKVPQQPPATVLFAREVVLDNHEDLVAPILVPGLLQVRAHCTAVARPRRERV